ncbi:Rhomboid-like protein 20 [Sarracenia purpurea var. burkii]
MNGGPSGFNNAPVARTFLIACGLFTIIFGIQGRSNKLGLSYQDIFKKLQLWKLVVSAFAFSSTPELIFGLYLLYYFRVFERQIGSNKYSVFVLFSIIVSLLLEVLALALLKDPTFNGLTSGPYGVIFSSFVPFFLDIPVSTRFRVFGLRFSDKFFIYLAGLQLLLSSWKRSILPGICGILAGSCYRLNVLHIRRLKFPDFIAAFFSRLSLPSTGSTVPTAPSRNVPRNIAPPYTGRQVEGNYLAPTSLTMEPPEDSIATLVSMGFDRNSARQALMHARNDVNAATNILLEAQSH